MLICRVREPFMRDLSGKRQTFPSSKSNSQPIPSHHLTHENHPPHLGCSSGSLMGVSLLCGSVSLMAVPLQVRPVRQAIQSNPHPAPSIPVFLFKVMDPLVEDMTLPPLRKPRSLSDETLVMVIRLALFLALLGTVPALVSLLKH